MLVGEPCESVYVVTCEGVKPLKLKLAIAVWAGSLLSTITVIEFPPEFVAAYTLNRFGSALCVAETEIGLKP